MSCNYNEWKKLKQQLEDVTSDIDGFIVDCAKELAARLLAKVIKRTPVGIYSASTGKLGGTLRRGWTGGERANGVAYAQSLQVNKTGDNYTVEIINPIEYASYVEFGHRTSNHEGWVNGRFMLTISEQELEAVAPLILEKRIQNLLEKLEK